MALAAGSRLGPYQMLALIGAGGMGQVYRARDFRLERDVAVKVLPPEVSGDAVRLRRFEQEARATAALNHPNILAVFDIGRDADTAYVVEELLEGQTLRDVLAQGALPVRRAVDYAIQIANGLAAAHDKGITHRDLKPDNLFVTSDSRVKILDFGLAKLMEGAAADAAVTGIATRIRDTSPGSVLGTVGYMSPEQLRGKAIDHRSDIFSFGAVLYEMLCASSPFHGESPADTISAILGKDPRDFPVHIDGVPQALERFVWRCLEKNPDHRFQSARDLAFALETTVVSSAGDIAEKYRGAGRSAAAPATAIDSIAVLPFATAGGDPESDYLSEGITESIINSLSQLPRLRVVPRNTVFRYRNREADSHAVGRELKVRTVLTGRIAERGATLVVSTELTDIVEDAQLWGERYTRQLSDIFALEDEIARQIVEKLRLRLGEGPQRLSRRYTDNPEAYRLYLKGRHCFYTASIEGFNKAIELFEKAIETDPTYALAYAGLADVFCIMGYAGLLPPGEAMPRAKAAARRALEIDEQLADAHSALATIFFHYDWNWAAAEREFKRAIELDAKNAVAYDWYGVHLTAMGRFDEGMAVLRRALQLDPLKELFQFHVGLNLLMRRQLDAAIREFGKAIELNPNDAWSLMNLADALLHRKKYEEAAAACDKAIAVYGPTFAPAKAVLCHAYMALGRSAEAHALVRDLERLSQQTYVSGYILAWAHLGLGQKEQAMDCLEKAYEERDVWMVWLRTDPMTGDRLNSEPRYQDLLRRMAFP